MSTILDKYNNDIIEININNKNINGLGSTNGKITSSINFYPLNSFHIVLY